MKQRIEMQKNQLSSDPQSQEMIPEVDSAQGKSSQRLDYIEKGKLINQFKDKKSLESQSHRDNQLAPLSLQQLKSQHIKNFSRSKTGQKKLDEKNSDLSFTNLGILNELPLEQETGIKKGYLLQRMIKQPIKKQQFQQQLLESDEEKLERMYRFQKQVKAKYNDISMSMNVPGKDEPYRYVIIRGNNSELVKRCLDDRNGDWQEINSNNTLFNFKWVPFSKGIRFDYLSGHGIKKMVNHFEFHEQITEKDNLLLNMTKFYESQRKNVFSVHPVTFSIDLSQSSSYNEIEKFQLYFNLLEKHKGTNPSQRLAHLNKDIKGIHLFPQGGKSKSCIKFSLCNNMFDGRNFWLLKPADYNRGRGVQVFNSLEQFKKLLIEFTQGVEVKVPNQATQNLDKSQVSKQSNQNQSSAIPPEQMLSNFTNLENVPNMVKTNAFVVQKYLERPLLINNRKFDIRLWVLITQENKCYLFKEGYIRTSSYEFDLTPESIDKQFIHLTNNAIQKFDEKYGAYEEGNQLSFQQAIDLLKSDGIQCDLYNLVYGSITNIIIDTIKSVESKINVQQRKFCMEIFGYDFILDHDLNPWLIEVNTNPCLEESSSLLQKLIPRMVDDALKLTLDQVFPPKRFKQLTKFHNGFSISVDEHESLKQAIITDTNIKGIKEPSNSRAQDQPLMNAIQNGNNNSTVIQQTKDIENTVESVMQQQQIMKEEPQFTSASSVNKTKYPVAGYPSTENMWNLIYQLKI